MSSFVARALRTRALSGWGCDWGVCDARLRVGVVRWTVPAVETEGGALPLDQSRHASFTQYDASCADSSAAVAQADADTRVQ